MKTVQAKTSHMHERRGYGFWMGSIAASFGLVLLIYYTYCWGLWGQGSLFLQYIFGCGCPASSEEARYPERIDVIVPACQYVSSRLSPSGRLLYLEEETFGPATSYLLDLQTHEKLPFFIPDGSNHFLTDDFIFLSLFYGRGYEGGEYILDRATEKQYPIQEFAYWRSGAYINGGPNLTVLAEGLRMAKDVFLIGNDTIIALAEDFRNYSERNFLIHQAAFPGREADRAQQFLQQNNISYHYVSDTFPVEALSPDGRFIARDDGIYLVETTQKIVEGYSASKYYRSYSGKYFSVRGWTYDGTGAIYSKFLTPCLIETGLFVIDEVGCFVEVPQPLILLKVPQEYLHTSTP